MRRRTVLGALTAALGAGCTTPYAPSGPRNPPAAEDARGPSPADETRPPGLFVVAWDFFEGPDGDLLVEATIGNDADDERSGTLVAVASTPDERVEAREEVTVASGEEVGAELPLDIRYETFAADGQISLDIER